MTIANVWPGTGVRIDSSEFRIEHIETPYMWISSPRGIGLVANVRSRLYSRGVSLPEPGLCERTGHPGGPYSLRGRRNVWAYAYANRHSDAFEVALWTAPHGCETRDMAQTHAVEEVESILAAGGTREAASFQASLGFGVAVRWDIRPYPPFTRYVVGRGWSYLPGYLEHQAALREESRVQEPKTARPG